MASQSPPPPPPTLAEYTTWNVWDYGTRVCSSTSEFIKNRFHGPRAPEPISILIYPLLLYGARFDQAPLLEAGLRRYAFNMLPKFAMGRLRPEDFLSACRIVPPYVFPTDAYRADADMAGPGGGAT